MRKKYLSALLFGALLVTSAGTFTSCKDYDDEINNLQEQVDALKDKVTVSPDEMKAAVTEAIAALETKLNEAIAGKADAAEVQSLLSKVTELQELVNNKASQEEIDALQAEIEALKESVNAIPGDLTKLEAELKAQKEEYTAKIAEIQQMIEDNGATEELQKKLDELILSLSETNNRLSEVETMAKNNAQAIVEIKTALEDLKDVNSKIESLQNLKADKNYVDEQIEAIKAMIPTDYLTEEGVNAAIESALEDYVSLEYMAAYSTTSEIKYLIGDAVANTLNAVEVMIEDAFKKNGYDKDEFEALVKHMASVNAALTQYQFDNVSDLIKSVSELQSNYTALNSIINGIEGKGGLVADVDALEDWKALAEKDIKDLNKEVDTLQKEVDLLFKIIRNINYVPENIEGTVEFNSLYFQNKDNEYVLGYKDNAKTLKFRVTPASAASDLEEFKKNYTVTVREDGAVSRSGNKYAVTLKDVKDGFITVELNTNDANASAIGTALAIELNTVSESVYTEYQNVTSDYVPVFVNKQEVTKVEYTCKNEAVDVIYRNTEEKSINYAEEGTYKLYNWGTEITGYNKEVFELFTTTFERDSFDKYYFDLNNGTLSLTNAGPSSYGQKAKVKAVTVVTIGDKKINEFEKEFAEVTVKNQIIPVNNIVFEAVDYGKTYKPFTITKQQIMDAAGLDAATYNDLKISTNNNTIDTRFVEDRTIMITKSDDGNIYVQLPDYALPVENKTIEFILSNNSETQVKVTFDITINDITDNIVDLVNVANIWDNNNKVTFIPEITGNDSEDFSIRVENLFVNWDKFEDALNDYYNTGENIWDYAILTSSNPDYVSVKDGNITLTKYNSEGGILTNKDFANVTLTLELKVAGDNEVETLRTFNLQVSNMMSGYWTKDKKATESIEFASSDAVNTSKYISGYSWNVKKVGATTDVTMWTSTKTDDNGFSNRRLAAPKFVITGADAEKVKQYVSIDQTTGKVTLNRNGFVLTAPLKATIEMQVSSPWGTIEGLSGNNTVELIIKN